MMVTRLPSGRFYGRSLRTLEVAGFALTECAYQAGAVLPRHSHARALFTFVVAGVYQERIGRRSAIRRRSALLYIPGDLTHEEVHATAGRRLVVEVTDDCLSRFGSGPAALTGALDLSGGEGRRLALRMYQELCGADAHTALVLEGLGLELLTLTCRRGARTEQQPPAWLVTVRDELDAGFAHPFTLAAIAARAGVHPVHLAQAFRRWFGCTLGEYVRELRLNDACAALVRSDASIADIALAAGFADQSHLCRVFRRLKGISPKAYQRRVREQRATLLSRDPPA
jgi:AraC family transcriptional regulator